MGTSSSTHKPSEQPYPKTSFLNRVLRSAITAEEMAEMIAAVTGESVHDVLKRLRLEFQHPGRTVRVDFKKRGLEPYVWNDELIRFYEQTDAFLYELTVWNWNKIKRKMRRRVADYLAGDQDARLDVLALGDRLGFDCVSLAARDHRITYFDVPGYTQQFASNLFSRCGLSIGLRLLDGEAGWNPIVVGRGDSAAHMRRGAAERRRLLRVVGWYLATARYCTAPLMPVHYYRSMLRVWFSDEIQFPG